MDANFINCYLDRAREIIGERSPSEVEYDDAVVEALAKNRQIKDAISEANRRHPEEALRPEPHHWDDLQARYEYIMEHKRILARLGIRE